jgi:hypothetical protein|tara:strand:+ start:2853 stop:3020 length:168 start_codon:yes stop_codon:yes gene_type:complete
MVINVSIGEWMKSLSERMSNASDGDCFCLPTQMHLHAFQICQESFPDKHFLVKVN